MGEELKCRRCDIAMNEGFIPTESNGFRRIASWQEGAPLGFLEWFKYKKQPSTFPIVVYRCPQCGLLEMIAAASKES